MLTRVYFVIVTAVFAAMPCYAGKPIVRDGSTMEKAILLKQRVPKAVEEEMAWMMKLYSYTPRLAIRDMMADLVREIKAGRKTKGRDIPFEHATLIHEGRFYSYWVFTTPHGQKKIYFDTGVAADSQAELRRQEAARSNAFMPSQ